MRHRRARSIRKSPKRGEHSPSCSGKRSERALCFRVQSRRICNIPSRLQPALPRSRVIAEAGYGRGEGAQLSYIVLTLDGAAADTSGLRRPSPLIISAKVDPGSVLRNMWEVTILGDLSYSSVTTKITSLSGRTRLHPVAGLSRDDCPPRLDNSRRANSKGLAKQAIVSYCPNSDAETGCRWLELVVNGDC